jgi:hypothetical protein
MTTSEDANQIARQASRRSFVRAGGALLGSVSTASLISSEARAEDSSNLPPNVPAWMKAPGDPVGSQLYGMPSPFEKSVVRNVPKNQAQYYSSASRTPLQELDGICEISCHFACSKGGHRRTPLPCPPSANSRHRGGAYFLVPLPVMSSDECLGEYHVEVPAH